MVGWHHQLNGHELEQTSGDSEGQGDLACSSPWGHKEVDVTLRLSDNNIVVAGDGNRMVEKLQALSLKAYNLAEKTELNKCTHKDCQTP